MAVASERWHKPGFVKSLLVVGCCMLGAQASAQEPGGAGGAQDSVHVYGGSKPLQLHREPPRQVPFLPFLRFPAREMSGRTIEKDEEYHIESYELIDTFVERSVWVSVKTEADGSGWVYAGPARVVFPRQPAAGSK